VGSIPTFGTECQFQNPVVQGLAPGADAHKGLCYKYGAYAHKGLYYKIRRDPCNPALYQRTYYRAKAMLA
jgi:hypothetical protein